MAFLANAGMTTLLLLLAMTIFVIPLVAAPFGDGGRALIELFFVMVLLSGAWVIADHRKIATALAALGVLALGIAWLPLPWLGAMRPLVHQAATLLAVVLLAAMVCIRVFSAGSITTQRVMGAVALYLLLGVAWGNAYEIIAQLDAGAFSHPVTSGGVERWFYFSFVTLTTVGYGDITPLSRSARVLAMGEAMVGQLYPAIILARLVTLQAAPKSLE